MPSLPDYIKQRQNALITTIYQVSFAYQKGLHNDGATDEERDAMIEVIDDLEGKTYDWCASMRGLTNGLLWKRSPEGDKEEIKDDN